MLNKYLLSECVRVYFLLDCLPRLPPPLARQGLTYNGSSINALALGVGGGELPPQTDTPNTHSDPQRD